MSKQNSSDLSNSSEDNHAAVAGGGEVETDSGDEEATPAGNNSDRDAEGEEQLDEERDGGENHHGDNGSCDERRLGDVVMAEKNNDVPTPADHPGAVEKDENGTSSQDGGDTGEEKKDEPGGEAGSEGDEDEENDVQMDEAEKVGEGGEAVNKGLDGFDDQEKADEEEKKDEPRCGESEGGEGEENDVPMDEAEKAGESSEAVNKGLDDQEKADDDSSTSSSSDEDETQESNAVAGEVAEESGLSEYEKLRLARIQRNQQYLAQLGLDKQQGAMKRKPSLTKKRSSSSVVAAAPRKSLSRRTKRESINYALPSSITSQRQKSDSTKLSRQRSDYDSAENEGGQPSTVAPGGLVDQKSENSADDGEGQDGADKDDTAEHDSALGSAPLSSGASKQNTRMDLAIHREFLRIRTSKKNALKQAKKMLGKAAQEVRYWMRACDLQEKRQIKMERRQAEEAARREAEAVREQLQSVDRRMHELQGAAQRYDSSLKRQHTAWELERQQEQMDQRAQLMQAFHQFPRALANRKSVLHTVLLERSPKGPPPPRRSRRGAPAAETAQVPASPRGRRGKRGATAPGKAEAPASPARKRRNVSTKKQQEQADDNNDDMGAEVLAPVVVPSISDLLAGDQDDGQEEAGNSSPRSTKGESSKSDAKNTAKRRKPKAKLVGGWVSPQLAQKLDREWLLRPQTHATLAVQQSQLHHHAYVPQVGDAVLYYPIGHRKFLAAFADVLGKKTRQLTRIPLWERAASLRKDDEGSERPHAARSRRSKGGRRVKPPQKLSEDQEETTETNENRQSESAKLTPWWSEAWVDALWRNNGGTEASDSEDEDFVCGPQHHPILCLVQSTCPEFPPDPSKASRKRNEDGTHEVVFDTKTSRQKQSGMHHAREPTLRLAVTLRPLTPIADATGECDDAKTPLPPTFAVVTFPASAFRPFLVPFGWAYGATHKLSVGDPVKSVPLSSVAGSRQGKILRVQTRCCAGSQEEQTVSNGSRVGSMVRGLIQQKFGGNIGAARADREIFGHLPRSEVTAVWNTMDGLLAKPDAESTCSAKTSVQSLWEIICGTLPLWDSVSLSENLRSDNDSGKRASPWELDAIAQSLKRKTYIPLSEGNQNESSMDETLQLKLCDSINHLIRTHPAASLFVDEVTDEMAPSYSCAVPIPMFFNRIMARLRASSEGNSGPFYRSLGAVMSDVSLIRDNCLLYNHPESAVVEQAIDVCTTAKELLAKVAKTHEKEALEVQKASEERQRLVMLHCGGSSSGHAAPQPLPSAIFPRADSLGSSLAGDNVSIFDNSNSTNNTGVLAACRIKQPYKQECHQEWLQAVEGSSTDVASWTPQPGDRILYSRQRHAKFVMAHFPSLEAEQCSLPPPPPAEMNERATNKTQSEQGADEPSSPTATGEGHSNMTNKTGEAIGVANQKDDKTDPPGLCGKSGEGENECDDDDWEIAVVQWTRATFPKLPVKKSGSHDAFTFATNSTLLALGVLFTGTGYQQIIYWRPCMFSFDEIVHPGSSSSELDTDQAEHNSRGVKKGCEACGLSASFVRPIALTDSVDQRNGESIQSECLSADEANTFLRCLELLKRRCMRQVSPSSIDERLTRASIGEGFTPSQPKIGPKVLPSYRDLLTKKSSTEHIDRGHHGTRNKGQRKKQTLAVDEHLTMDGYVPPWLHELDQDNPEPSSSPWYETVSPWSKLSLELVQARLELGYYRHREAVENDLVEAFASTCFLVLADAAGRKKAPISLKRVARMAASTMPHSGRKERPQANRADGEENEEEATTAEEEMWAARISNVRELYATALVCISDGKNVERLFGISSVQSSVSSTPPPPVVEDPEKADARKKLAHLLAALGRDGPTNNSSSFSSMRLEQPKGLKIFCGGEQISVERHYQKVTRAVAYDFNGGKDVFVKVKVGRQEAFTLVEAPCQDTIESSADTIEHKNSATESRPVHVRVICDGETMKIPSPEDVRTNKIVTRPLDKIEVDETDLEGDTALAHFFLGRPGRKMPCVRCQAFRRSMLACRVRRGHANVDLDFTTFFEGCGSLDKLLHLLDPLSYPHARPSTQASSVAANGKETAMMTDPPEASQETNIAAGGVVASTTECEEDQPAASTSKGKETENPMQTRSDRLESGQLRVFSEEKEATENAVGEADHSTSPVEKSKVDKPENADQLGTVRKETPQQKDLYTGQNADARTDKNREGRQSAPSQEGAEQKLRETDAGGNETASTGPSQGKQGSRADEDKNAAGEEADPKKMLIKAQSVLDYAEEIVAKAEKYAASPDLMTRAFIESNIPVDQDDGHYIYCIICGLSGDLLCCDGCPNVVHAACVKLETVPEGEWFCEECHVNGKTDSATQEPNASRDPAPVEARETSPPPHSIEKGGGKSQAFGRVSFDTSTVSQLTDKVHELLKANPEKKLLLKRTANKQDTGGVSGSGGNEQRSEPATPFDVLSSTIREFLKSIGITTAEDLVTTRTTKVGKAFGEWRKVKKMSEMKTGGEIASVSTWKRACRDAAVQMGVKLEGDPGGGVTWKDDDDESSSSDEESEGDDDWSKRPRRGATSKAFESMNDPIDALSAMAQEFFKSLRITTADEFLDLKTSETAKKFGKWRKRNKLPKLRGSGEVATISAWKTTCRNAIEAMNRRKQDTSSAQRSGKKQAGQKQKAEEVVSPRSRRAEKRSRTNDDNGTEKEDSSEKSKGADQRSKGADERAKKKRRPNISDRGSSSTMTKDALEVLSGPARDFLASINIESAEDFLSRRTCDVAVELGKWRQEQGLPKLRGSGNGATISAWRTQCRNAQQSLEPQAESSNENEGEDSGSESPASPSAAGSKTSARSKRGDGESAAGAKRSAGSRKGGEKGEASSSRPDTPKRQRMATRHVERPVNVEDVL